jgi:hypothetical protein
LEGRAPPTFSLSHPLRSLAIKPVERLLDALRPSNVRVEEREMSNHAHRRGRRRPTPVAAELARARLASCDCPECSGESLEDFHRGLLEEVDDGGFTVVGNWTTLGPLRLWGHTIGVGRSLGAPELVVTGSEEAECVWLIASVIYQLLGGVGATLGRDTRHRIDAGDHDHVVCLVEVDPRLVVGPRLLRVAHELSAALGTPQRAVQVVLEDGAGHMPWEPGCREPGRQVLLDAPPPAMLRGFT